MKLIPASKFPAIPESAVKIASEWRCSAGYMTRLPLGKGRRGTSWKFRAFSEVQFSLVLLYFEGRRTSKKSFRNLSLA